MNVSYELTKVHKLTRVVLISSSYVCGTGQTYQTLKLTLPRLLLIVFNFDYFWVVACI